MKKKVSKLFRLERSSGRLLLLAVSVLWLAVFLPALSPAADTSPSKPLESTTSSSQAEIDIQKPTGTTGHDDQRIDERQPKQGLAPQRNGASYPIVTTEPRRALRSIKRAQSDFDRSMRSLNDSLRRANSAINRIRSLNKKF